MSTLKDWYVSAGTTASSTSSYTGNYAKYDDYVIQADKAFDKAFDKKMFNEFEMTIKKHRDKKNKELDTKKEYMFDPDDLYIEGDQ